MKSLRLSVAETISFLILWFSICIFTVFQDPFPRFTYIIIFAGIFGVSIPLFIIFIARFVGNQLNISLKLDLVDQKHSFPLTLTIMWVFFVLSFLIFLSQIVNGSISTVEFGDAWKIAFVYILIDLILLVVTLITKITLNDKLKLILISHGVLYFLGFIISSSTHSIYLSDAILGFTVLLFILNIHYIRKLTDAPEA